MKLRYRLIKVLPHAYQSQFQRGWIEEAYARDIEKVRKAGGDIDGARECMQFDLQQLDEEDDHWTTQKLLRQASRLQVPLPARPSPLSDGPQDWYEAELIGRYNLSTQGINKLRAAIRTEQKGRSEVRVSWLPWLTALTGLVGTITGLVAAFKK